MENQKFCAVMVFVVVQIGKKNKQTKKTSDICEGSVVLVPVLKLALYQKQCGMVRSPTRAKSEKVE